LSKGTAEVEERFGKYRAEKVSSSNRRELELTDSNLNSQTFRFNTITYLLDSLHPNHPTTPSRKATMMSRNVSPKLTLTSPDSLPPLPRKRLHPRLK